MNIIHCQDYERLSIQAASLVIAEIEKRKDLLLCVAAGHSASGCCERLANEAETNRTLFAGVSVVKLDEWGGVSENDPVSSERYLRTRVLDPLRIPAERFLSIASNPVDPARECERVRSELERRGPIDVSVLGLGINGHLGFNEPAPFLVPQCHVAQLSEESRRHHMVRSMTRKPRFGLTLGMQEILASEKILLLVAGDGKERALARLVSGEVTTTVPASFLWLHDNVDCLIDQSALTGQEA